MFTCFAGPIQYRWPGMAHGACEKGRLWQLGTMRYTAFRHGDREGCEIETLVPGRKGVWPCEKWDPLELSACESGNLQKPRMLRSQMMQRWRSCRSHGCRGTGQRLARIIESAIIRLISPNTFSFEIIDNACENGGRWTRQKSLEFNFCASDLKTRPF